MNRIDKLISEYSYEELIAYNKSLFQRLDKANDGTVKKILRRKLAEINRQLMLLDEIGIGYC